MEKQLINEKLRSNLQKTDDEIIKLQLLLAYLFKKKEENINDIWLDFEKEIKNKNRFFLECKQRVFDLFDECKSYAICKLNEKSKIYRARTIDYSNFPEKTKKLFELSEKINNSNFIAKIGNSNWEKLLTPDAKKVLEDVYNDDFWGYTEVESDAPPSDKATAQRANPEGISYLYGAENIKTAISEMRPIISQYISVAEIEINKPLKLFDFISTIKDADNTLWQEATIMKTIAKYMSKPNYGNIMDYLPTQYICEMLRREFDFDGIRFKSSLTEGNNIVLFDTPGINGKHSNYKILNSSLYNIKTIIVEEEKILPIRKQK
ncbi:MAG: RES family NAD+ phosphorylase [Treponema sp.]|nr:RES family NAD+ phosphorylase [Treponema sp.]